MSTVLVAGGATGIGAAVVRAFRAQGDDVLLADCNGEAACELISEAAPGGGDYLVCDFATPEAPAAAVAAAAALGHGLDTVFYNAAVLDAHPLGQWSVEAWDRSCAVNLRAPFLITQEALPYLRSSASGTVVLTSSTGALRGHAGMPAYHATKAGLLGMVRSLADEMGPAGITVNALCPGWVDTPFNDTYWQHQSDPAAAVRDLIARIPLRRQARPEDIAGMVVYLASPAARYVTGQALVVDGGYTAV